MALVFAIAMAVAAAMGLYGMAILLCHAMSMAIAMAAMDVKPRFKGFINRFLS